LMLLGTLGLLLLSHQCAHAADANAGADDVLFNDSLMQGGTSKNVSDQTLSNHTLLENPASPETQAPSDDEAFQMAQLAKVRQRTPDRFETKLLPEFAQTQFRILDALVSLSRTPQLGNSDAIAPLFAEAQYHMLQAESAHNQGNLRERDYWLSQANALLSATDVQLLPSRIIDGRSVWFDRGTIVACKDPNALKAHLQRLAKAGFNIVYFETLNAGFPIYPSQLLKQNPMVEGWDPLNVAVTEAHRLGMELHAWVWCFAVGNTRHNPIIGASPDFTSPIFEAAGLRSEALETARGSIYPPGQTEYWLSPASEKAQDFLISLYSEIVKNYPVDGIQLDYIRYPFQKSHTQTGFEALSRKAFMRDTGMDLRARDELTLKTFIAWKTLRVSQFVRKVSETLRPLRPGLQISGAVFPLPRAQRIIAIQQDWETWTANGWMDILCPMIYTGSPGVFEQSVKRIVTNSNRKPVYPGVAAFRFGPTKTVNALYGAFDQKALGATLFAYTHLDDDKLAMLKAGPLKLAPALAPHQPPVAIAATLFPHMIDTLTQQRDLLQPESLQQLTVLTTAWAALKPTLSPLVADLPVAAAEAKPAPVKPAFQPAWKTASTALSKIEHQESAAHPFIAQWCSHWRSQLDSLAPRMGL